MFMVQEAGIAIFDKSHLFILNKHKYLQKSCLTTTYLCFISLFNNVEEKFLFTRPKVNYFSLMSRQRKKSPTGQIMNSPQAQIRQVKCLVKVMIQELALIQSSCLEQINLLELLLACFCWQRGVLKLIIIFIFSTYMNVKC